MALKWTPEEDEILLAGMREKKNYSQISGKLKNRTPRAVAYRGWLILSSRDVSTSAKSATQPAKPVHWLESIELTDAIAWAQWNNIWYPETNINETSQHINAARLKFGLPMWEILPNRRQLKTMPAPHVEIAEVNHD
jgi:hypothetical protein